MIIGSHLSFSYLKPDKWYHYFMIPFIKHQSKNLLEQYNSNIRCFDIHVRFDKNNNLILCNGLCKYKLEIPTRKIQIQTANAGLIKLISDKFYYLDFIDWILNYLPNKEKIIFRLILDIKKENIQQENFFKIFCREFINKIKENNYPHELTCCTRKFDWKHLFDCKYYEIIIDKEKNYQEYNTEIILKDFV